MLFRLGGVVCMAALVAAIPAAAQDDGASRRARNDYILHCSGCHAMDGSGHPAKGIPTFQNQVGYFTAIAQGRALFGVRVDTSTNVGVGCAHGSSPRN